MNDFADLDQAFSEAKKPTEIAKVRAETAARYAMQAGMKGAPNSYEQMVANSIENLSLSIHAMTVGIRATYMLLEKIERQQQRR